MSRPLRELDGNEIVINGVDGDFLVIYKTATNTVDVATFPRRDEIGFAVFLDEQRLRETIAALTRMLPS